jgi:hypothetical protein
LVHALGARRRHPRIGAALSPSRMSSYHCFMRAVGVAVAAVGALLGCAGGGGDAGLAPRVAALRQEQEQRQVQLALIQQQIDAAQRLLALRQCEAQQAGVNSEIAVRRAQCVQQRSEYAACVAKNESHTAKSGLWGCGGGIAAAILTGGAAIPLATLGCGGGLALGAATTANCGAGPVCTPDAAVLLPQVLAEHGLQSFPKCD